MATAPSPAALVGPCIERILQGATGRKYAKMRQDAQVRRHGGVLARFPMRRRCSMACSKGA